MQIVTQKHAWLSWVERFVSVEEVGCSSPPGHYFFVIYELQVEAQPSPVVCTSSQKQGKAQRGMHVFMKDSPTLEISSHIRDGVK